MAFAALLLIVPAAMAQPVSAINTGNVAWVLTSTLLVLMMAVPGVALLYAGLVRSKNVLSILMQVLAVFSMVLLLWAFYGYSLAFDGGGAIIGGLGKAFLHGVTPHSMAGAGTGLPEYAYFAFEATFAGITCAAIVGALAERVKFGAVLLFTLIWFTLAYLPITHMVWSPHGWLNALGAIDFAGGLVVHLNAGMAGLVAAALLGKRADLGRTALRPHNLPLAMIGVALLWVGWFGFNAGSELQANAGAALAFVDTLLSTATGVLVWLGAEALILGRPSMLGGISGVIAGAAGVTPACSSVGPMGAIAIGGLTSLACLWGVNGLKHWLRVDDALDVFGVHGVGGIAGVLLTGIFSAKILGGTGGNGFGMLHQLGIQALAVVVTMAWSGLAALLAGLAVKWLYGFRVHPDHERAGLDTTVHGESAYDN